MRFKFNTEIVRNLSYARDYKFLMYNFEGKVVAQKGSIDLYQLFIFHAFNFKLDATDSERPEEYALLLPLFYSGRNNGGRPLCMLPLKSSISTFSVETQKSLSTLQ